MKHQYFGDVNDYHKYGILRALTATGDLRVGLCWMLTAADARADGGKVAYLAEPDRWGPHDPPLFEFLRNAVHRRQRRDVSLIEASGLLQGHRFFSEALTDSLADRREYFARMLNQFADSDVIFFDPDNGLEIASVPLGRRNSSKYLYLAEVEAAYGGRKSVLIFQHFPRERRDQFMVRRVQQVSGVAKGARVFCFRTASVAYLLAAHPCHVAACRSAARAIASAWEGQIAVVRQPVRYGR